LDWQEHNKENMNLREFVRLSFQHRIIPTLIERPDDIVKIYKHSVKGEKASLQLNYEQFKKCLIRVAVLAQDQIGGQKEEMLD
jgi:DNA-binding NtrC family response regulator